MSDLEVSRNVRSVGIFCEPGMVLQHIALTGVVREAKPERRSEGRRGKNFKDLVGMELGLELPKWGKFSEQNSFLPKISVEFEFLPIHAIAVGAGFASTTTSIAFSSSRFLVLLFKILKGFRMSSGGVFLGD